MEPTLAMHSLMNVQRKTEPVTVQKQVDGKQQVQTTQVQRTPVMVQQESTTPLVIANTTQTKAPHNKKVQVKLISKWLLKNKLKLSVKL
ncbi:MAG: hypothetical protein E7C91_06450 [Veillonella sp.]|nr:hypothetical protein [Veillonella sp.]